MSSYNDGECLQLTKVSSLMTVLYLAFAEPVCPQFNQRPGSHGNDTEHLGVHDLPNTVTKCRMKRTNNSSKWINALFFSARDFEVFRRASQPHMLEYFCKKRALLTQVTVTNLFFFVVFFLILFCRCISIHIQHIMSSAKYLMGKQFFNVFI